MCDEIVCEAELRQIFQADWSRLQQRDCSCHLSQNRTPVRIALTSFNFSADALGQAEEGGNSPGVIEGTQPLSVFRRHAHAVNSQLRGNLFEPFECRLVELHPVFGQILQSGSERADLRRGLPVMAIKEEPEDLLIALKRQKLGDGTNGLGIVAAMHKGRRCEAKLVLPLL